MNLAQPASQAKNTSGGFEPRSTRPILGLKSLSGMPLRVTLILPLFCALNVSAIHFMYSSFFGLTIRYVTLRFTSEEDFVEPA